MKFNNILVWLQLYKRAGTFACTAYIKYIAAVAPNPGKLISTI
jgi:hypothetical protein